MSGGQNNLNAMHELKTHEPAESAVRSIGLVRCECGCTGFIRTTQMRGKWTEYLEYLDDGTVRRESTTDDLEEISTPKTIKCDKCGKRRPNPEAPNISIS